MRFTDVPITLAGNTYSFDFEYRELTEYGQACFIRSGDREMAVDEDFAVIRNEFPADCEPVIIDKLKQSVGYGS